MDRITTERFQTINNTSFKNCPLIPFASNNVQPSQREYDVSINFVI